MPGSGPADYLPTNGFRAYLRYTALPLESVTGPMRTEAVKAGYYETLYGKYFKSQILTIAESRKRYGFEFDEPRADVLRLGCYDNH